MNDRRHHPERDRFGAAVLLLCMAASGATVAVLVAILAGAVL